MAYSGVRWHGLAISNSRSSCGHLAPSPYQGTLLDSPESFHPRYEICQDHRQATKLLSAEKLADIDSSPGLARARQP